MPQSIDRIKELLGTGLGPEVVATAVGCNQSYVSQLMGDPDFAAEVIELRSIALTAASARDRKADSIEDKLLDRLNDLVDGGAIYKVQDVLLATRVANSLKRRGVPAHESLTINQTVVNLTLPGAVVSRFRMNANNEVVEADGQTLVTMSSASLLKTLGSGGNGNGKANVTIDGSAIGSQLLEAAKGKDNALKDKYREVSRYLPSAIGSASREESETSESGEL